MRLWHEKLIPVLPRQQLLGQHREICALLGKGWMKKHIVVDYVFSYDKEKLKKYHILIINEMKKRNYKVNEKWIHNVKMSNNIYTEHNDDYFLENILNLERKNIILDLKSYNIDFNDCRINKYRLCKTRNEIYECQKLFYCWTDKYRGE